MPASPIHLLRRQILAYHVRHPVLLSVEPGHAPWAFATLFFIESMARASLATVMPLHAYALFGDKGTVSLAYTTVALAALAFSFTIPLVIRLFSRRWSYTIGAVMIALSGLLLATDTVSGQLGAMFVRTFGAATLNITLNLYIMDYIHKNQLVHSEPLRYAVSTVAWIIAPLLGVFFYERYGVWASAIVPALGAAALIAAFWYLRMSERGPIRPGVSQPVNPLVNIRRFVAQPRLRLAWFIAFSRSAFWVTFFIYVPILMVEGGLGPYSAGIAIAAGNAMLFNNLLVTRWARLYTVRKMIAIALAGGAFFVMLCGLAGVPHAFVAGLMIVTAAFFISILDGLGPIPFMRAVRAHERPQMTTVYRTYLDSSELLPPFVYFFAFLAFGFSGAFYALALLLAVAAWLVWVHVPKGL
jgi:MFS family permease